jgi:uncharacterized protein YndB with AHSA1/START domain
LAEPGFGHTRVSRIIEAGRERLFQALTDAAALQACLPPGTMTGRISDFDARDGGGYRMSLLYPASDQQHRGKSGDKEDRVMVRFVELRSPERVLEAVRFESDDPGLAGEMMLEIRLAEAGGGTEVTMTCDHIPPGVRPEDNEAGCRESLEQLARYVAQQEGGRGA